MPLDELRRPRPSKSSGVHAGRLLFGAQGAVWAFLFVGSDVSLTSRTICVGTCLFRTLSVTLLGDLWQFCLHVSVCSICRIGNFVVFCKMGNSGSVH